MKLFTLLILLMCSTVYSQDYLTFEAFYGNNDKKGLIEYLNELSERYNPITFDELKSKEKLEQQAYFVFELYYNNVVSEWHSNERRLYEKEKKRLRISSQDPKKIDHIAPKFNRSFFDTDSIISNYMMVQGKLKVVINKNFGSPSPTGHIKKLELDKFRPRVNSLHERIVFDIDRVGASLWEFVENRKVVNDTTVEYAESDLDSLSFKKVYFLRSCNFRVVNHGMGLGGRGFSWGYHLVPKVTRIVFNENMTKALLSYKSYWVEAERLFEKQDGEWTYIEEINSFSW